MYDGLLAMVRVVMVRSLLPSAEPVSLPGLSPGVLDSLSNIEETPPCSYSNREDSPTLAPLSRDTLTPIA